MNKFRRIWKRMRKYERVALILTIGSVVAMLVLGILCISQMITLNIEIIAALMALLMAAQTVQQWRKSRQPAIYCLITAVVLVLFTIFVYFAV